MSNGVLVAGTRIKTDEGTLTADGSTPTTPSTSPPRSPELEGRRHLYPPSEDMPLVVYLGDETGESELLEALRAGRY